jgi:hypothetical protein
MLISRENKKAMYIAKPPMRGVDLKWTFLSPGWSTAPRKRAIFPAKGVKR